MVVLLLVRILADLVVEGQLQGAHSRLEDEAFLGLDASHEDPWVDGHGPRRVEVSHVSYSRARDELLEVFILLSELLLLVLFYGGSQLIELVPKSQLLVNTVQHLRTLPSESLSELPVQVLIVLLHFSILLVFSLQHANPLEGVGQSLVGDYLAHEELPQRRLLEVLVPVGLHQLKHDDVDLIIVLLVQAPDCDSPDLVEALVLVLEENLRLVDPIGAEHEGEKGQRLLDVYLLPLLEHPHALLLFLLLGPVHALQELNQSLLVVGQGVPVVPQQSFLLNTQSREVRQVDNLIDGLSFIGIGSQILGSTLVNVSGEDVVLLSDGVLSLQEVRRVHHDQWIVELSNS